MSNLNKFTNFLFFIICLIFIMFILLGEVDALTINQQLTASNIKTQNGSVHKSFNSLFKNQGEGQVIYQFLVTGKRNINTLVLCVSGPNNYSSCSPCQFGTTSGYNDSSTQQVFYSLVCNVDTSNNRYVSNLILEGYAWESTYINWGSNIQFTNFNDNSDYSQVLSNVDKNLNSISSAVWGTNTYTSQIKNNLDTIITNMNTSNSQLIKQIQQQQQQQHQDSQNINNSIKDTNDTLKDSSIDSNNTTTSTSSWNSKNASNGTITNLLTLPIQLIQGYVNGMNSSCTPFNLGNLIGSSLWSVIDVLFSGFMIFGISKKLIKIFNDFTNMKSNQVDELYGGGA